jgi:fibronectin type 3 domain-containing protein
MMCGLPGGRGRTVIPALFALAALAACEQVDVTTVQVESVEVSPAVASVDVNGTTSLTAVVRGIGGAQLSGRPVSWSSLDPAVATVNNGVVTGMAPGTARIRASVEAFADTAVVHVAAAQPVIALSPTSLSFTATAQGSSPPLRTVTVTEAGGNAALGGLAVEVAYPAGQPAGWVMASLASSSAPTQLSVGAALGALSPGNYSATVRVSATGAANSPQSIAVQFEVEAALPRMALSRPDASFAASVGGDDPTPVSIAVTNSGSGTVSGLQRSVSYGSGQPTGWLTTELSGTTAPATLTLRATTGSLASGTYTATVRLSSGTATNSPIDVPVTFAVASVAPAAPADLQATAVSGTQIDLSWTAPEGAPVGRYRIERRVGSGAFALIDSVGGSATSYQDGGLSSATQYGYRMQACNAAGCSGYSSTASATTPQVAPGAPSNLQASAASSSRIDLAWTAASGAVHWYRIQRRSGAGAFSVIDSVAGNVTSFQNTGLAAGTHYTYQVLACNAAGCSDPSNQASATTAEVVPEAPTSPAADAISPTEIKFSWNEGSGNTAWYIVQRRTGGGSFAKLDSVAAATTEITDTGLTPSTQYGYQVQACNGAGCSSFTSEATATTHLVAPGAPSALNATAVSTSQIDLAWDAATGTVGWYIVEGRTGGGSFAQIDSVAGATTNSAHTGLDPGTQYFYRVKACNDTGCSSFTAEATATTHPEPPSSLDATAVSASRIDLSWTAPAAGTVGWYLVQRRSGGGSFEQVDSVAGGTTTLADTGLKAATQYDYRVQACNSGGCSEFSNEASATTEPTESASAPATPTGVTVVALSPYEVRVSWNTVTGAEEYQVRKRLGTGGSWDPHTAVAATETTHVEADLQPATTYQFQVAACNSAGCSQNSSPETIMTLAATSLDIEGATR